MWLYIYLYPGALQLAASDIVYLFDAFTMEHTCISYGLDRIFSSSTILKVGTYDLHALSSYHGTIYDALICSGARKE